MQSVTSGRVFVCQCVTAKTKPACVCACGCIYARFCESGVCMHVCTQTCEYIVSGHQPRSFRGFHILTFKQIFVGDQE